MNSRLQKTLFSFLLNSNISIGYRIVLLGNFFQYKSDSQFPKHCDLFSNICAYLPIYLSWVSITRNVMSYTQKTLLTSTTSFEAENIRLNFHFMYYTTKLPWVPKNYKQCSLSQPPFNILIPSISKQVLIPFQISFKKTKAEGWSTKIYSKANFNVWYLNIWNESIGKHPKKDI